ncbi:bZIP transcription factor [Oesophagostomum dentatum]|uniref:BZIP transcription factor n=1 Tax=Oesophagostomum dentatum TaxID=61180 RepID=A0A0B1TRQ5_OESDE|nr:bZIP transcription factor [Oesophagostomum dentatum]
MSRHPYNDNQRPSCSYQQRPSCRFTQPSPADSSCSSTLAPPLTSPIGNPAIGNRLNPLAPPAFGYPRGPLQYDLNAQYMGGARKTGGRRPKEFEMGPEIEDQEELDKKLKRRQRNKEAAARCRQRRLDLMTNLQEQVDKYKADNEKKELEIRAMKSQMAQMESFLRSHDCKMSVEERESLLNMPAIRPATMPPIMNGISKLYYICDPQNFFFQNYMKGETHIIGTNPPQHPVSDYRPNIEVTRKRVLPAPQLPAHSDANFLEPDIKCPKIEKDVSLSDLNGDTITRPNHINFEGIGLGSNHVPLSTPSNITYSSSVPYTTPNNYTPGFPGLNNDFLNDSTGLTPCTQQNPIFVSTPTPLQTSEADLRAL